MHESESIGQSFCRNVVGDWCYGPEVGRWWHSGESDVPQASGGVTTTAQDSCVMSSDVDFIGVKRGDASMVAQLSNREEKTVS